MRRYHLRLNQTASGKTVEVTDLPSLQFRTRALAEAWANTHQNAFEDPRLANAIYQTRWEVVDRGPWWKRTWNGKNKP